jgi:hypothetical protein
VANAKVSLRPEAVPLLNCALKIVGGLLRERSRRNEDTKVLKRVHKTLKAIRASQ